MKLLAIDFGLKRLGFAIGNSDINTVTPLDALTYKNAKQAFDFIQQLIDEYEINCILLGYPLNMDGSKNKITQQVERFKINLGKTMNPEIGIELVDERLSSFEAEEQLKSLHPHYKKRNRYLDSMSALVILRRFMERK